MDGNQLIRAVGGEDARHESRREGSSGDIGLVTLMVTTPWCQRQTVNGDINRDKG